MKQKALHILIILIALLPAGVHAQKYAVSGYVIDESSSETLIGATVFHVKLGRGVVTDRNGYFQMVGLRSGTHELQVSFLGYATDTLSLTLVNKGLMVPAIKLKPQMLSVGEVSIVAAGTDRPADRQVETSMIELSAKTIQSIPGAGNDVFSAIKFLPGIDRTEPFSPLYTVRGGEPGENAVLLDGIMIYNPYHSSLNSGIFNTQMIKSVDLLVGGFGAEYGGRNSSVMYISSKDGNASEIHGEIEPSTFQSKVFLEFPVGEKGSGIVAGRYFYDVFSQFIFQSKSYFYDFNLSYTYRLNSRNRLSFKYFQSRDRNVVDFNTFYKYLGNTIDEDFYDDFDLQLINRWTNRAGTVIHKCSLSPRVYLRSQVYYSSHSSNNYSGFDLRFEIAEEEMDTVRFRLTTSSAFTNHLADLSGKSYLNIILASFSTLRLGAEVNSYLFRNSAEINGIDQGEIEYTPLQYSLVVEDKLHAGGLIVRPGVRFTQYDNRNWFYEPRLNATLLLPGHFKLKAAWGTYYQYVISMNTNEVEMNQAVDYYFPLTRYQPSKSIHYIVGAEKAINRMATLGLDLYYKDIQRVYTFDINQTDNQVLTLSDKLQQGIGEAYGGELMLKGVQGSFSGWLSYGLAWATRRYSLMNGGVEYPYDFNRRHTIKTVVNYVASKNLEYNIAFTYLSGNYRSIEQSLQNYYYLDPVSNQLSFFPVWLPSGKNTAKMPAIINLDLSIRKRLRSGFGKMASEFFKAKESYVTVTLKNLTFLRRNVEYYYPISGVDRWEGKYLPIGMNWFPTVGISYAIKF